MILVDTSVWVDHFRRSNAALVQALTLDLIMCHAFVIGELACGNLPRRAFTLQLLSALPRSPVARHDETMQLLREASLHGTGLGWVDMHLLCSARTTSSRLWTLDRTLASAAETTRVALFQP